MIVILSLNISTVFCAWGYILLLDSYTAIIHTCTLNCKFLFSGSHNECGGLVIYSYVIDQLTLEI